jgi:trehalose monomycolate/heme transporter
MFLVPSVMKLLGDECWWAPRWMKRLQHRIGLNDVDLPDERERSAVPEPEPEKELEKAAVGAGAPVPPLPHDPTHPAVEASAERVDKAAQLETLPSLVDTGPMSIIDGDGDAESPAMRISSAESPELSVDGDATAPTQNADGDEPEATTAVPSRRQEDPEAT